MPLFVAPVLPVGATAPDAAPAIPLLMGLVAPGADEGGAIVGRLVDTGLLVGATA